MVNAQFLLRALAGEAPVGGGGGFAVAAVAVFTPGLITQLGDFGQRGVTGFNRHTAAAQVVAEQVENTVLGCDGIAAHLHGFAVVTGVVIFAPDRYGSYGTGEDKIIVLVQSGSSPGVLELCIADLDTW